MPRPRERLYLELQRGVLQVFRVGATAPIVTQNAVADTRPYMHPILVPDGTGSVTENAPGHHPWQHGLYVGLNEVNGVGFWMEGLRAERAHLDGTFHPSILKAPASNGDRATWAVLTEYRGPAGDTMLHETQEWTLTDLGDRYLLDLRWTLSADTDLTFGEYAYGGLFLRMPFRQEVGGTAITSEGHNAAEAEGQRARWVAVSMPVADQAGEVQVAILDHPDNLEHPVPWRVDNELGINPSPSIAGAWHIPTGSSEVFRYRLLVHNHPVEVAEIDAAWAAFATQESA